MKKILILTGMILSGSCFAFTMNELAGVYRASIPLAPIVSTITIESDGTTSLHDQVGTFNCTGFSQLETETKLITDLSCTNGMVISFTINLSDVQNLNSFQAPVDSLMTGELVWNFKKLRSH